MNTKNIILIGLALLAVPLALFAAWSIAVIPLSITHPLVLGAGGIFLVVILMRPHYGAFAMVATFWLSTLFPAEGGLTLNRMIGLVTLGGVIFPLTRTSFVKTKFGFSKSDYFGIGFLGIALVSVIVNGAYPRTTGQIWELLMGYLLYWLLRNTIDSRKRLKTLLWVIVVCNVVVALSVVNAYVTSDPGVTLYRIQGIQQVNTTGIFGAVAILIVLWLYHRPSDSGPRIDILKYGLVALFAGAIFLTGNRSGVAALLASLFIIGLFSPKRRGNTGVFSAVGLLIVSAVVIASIAPGTINRVINIPIGILSQSTSVEELDILDRVQLTQGAWRMFIANPVFGIGFGGYGYQLGKYVPVRVGSTSIAHNIYLSALAETGIFGFVMVLMIFGTYFSQLWKRARSANILIDNKTDSIYLLAIFVGVSVNALMHGAIIDRLTFIVFGLIMVVLELLENPKDS